ncbi:MAG: IS110 family transposase, partial [Dermatophilaceae bacterium]
MNSLAEIVEVVIGVDTHVETHTAAVVDARTGAVLEELTVPTTPRGYQELVDLAEAHSPLRAWAIEGTGGHGAGLARHLARGQEVVVELDRPERAKRRHGAKSDPLDAVRAAREALSRPKLGTPRAGGDRQALSVLLAARRSAVDASTIAQRQLFSLVIAAPEHLRAKLRGRKLPEMVRVAARLRVQPGWDRESTTTASTLRLLARRAQTLGIEAAELEKQILSVVRAWRPDLLEQPGVGPIVAATVLCAWSHPGRIRSEAAFAMLAGAAPIPANSGQITTRYRLNRYGDRQLNRALHVVVLSRQRYHAPTKAYTDRRTTNGKTPRD